MALNPTATLAPALVRTAGTRVDYFGPGFSSAPDLEAGLARYEAAHGPYDAVILGPNVQLFSEDPKVFESAAINLSTYNALAAEPAAVIKGLRNIRDDLPRLTTRTKCLWLLNFDYYAASPSQVETIDNLGLVVIGPNEQFITRLADLPDYAREEKHYQRKQDRISDAFRNWIASHPERVIPLPHYVAESELGLKSLESRRLDISIPGVEYVQRRRAIGSLRTGGMRKDRKLVFNLFRLASALKLRPHASYLGNQVYNAAFREKLLDTRYVFTARGGFGIPIRKFFEIPASGALMICVPPVGFADIGFRVGETHVECEPEQITEVIRDLMRRLDDSQKIATAGRDVIANAHTLGRRADQLASALVRLRDGTYSGARWVDGTFQLRGGA